jgi:hypothetical protein
MSFAPTTPITGAAVTGLTSPTYTIAADTPPNANSKQFAVTALGGTQTGVDSNSVSKPFSLTMFRPAVLRSVPQINPITGVLKNVPVNSYKVITRKGAQPAANQVSLVARITTTIDVPAGVDTYEPEEIRAMVSAHIGLLNQQADGIASTILTGVL